MAGADRLREELSAEMQRYISAAVRLQVAIAHQLELPVSDVHALAALRDLGPAGVGGLADAMGVTTSAATRMADRLERGGYLRREIDPADRRRVVLRVVPERIEEIARRYRPMDRHWQRQVERYSGPELRLLLGFLTDGRDAAEQETAKLRSAGRSHATRRRPEPKAGGGQGITGANPD